MRVSARKLMAEAFDALEAGQSLVATALKTRNKSDQILYLQHIRDVTIPSLTASVNNALARLTGEP